MRAFKVPVEYGPVAADVARYTVYAKSMESAIVEALANFSRHHPSAVGRVAEQAVVEVPTFLVGGRYNWMGQKEHLIYLGRNWSGNGYWNQFALVEDPNRVWCEVLDEDMEMIVESFSQEGVKSE